MKTDVQSIAGVGFDAKAFAQLTNNTALRSLVGFEFSSGELPSFRPFLAPELGE